MQGFTFRISRIISPARNALACEAGGYFRCFIKKKSPRRRDAAGSGKNKSKASYGQGSQSYWQAAYGFVIHTQGYRSTDQNNYCT